MIAVRYELQQARVAWAARLKGMERSRSFIKADLTREFLETLDKMIALIEQEAAK